MRLHPGPSRITANRPGATLEHSPIAAHRSAGGAAPRCRRNWEGAKRYYDLKERCIFCDIVRQEINTGSRVVLETEQFLVICPLRRPLPLRDLGAAAPALLPLRGFDIPTSTTWGGECPPCLREIDKVRNAPPTTP